MKASMLFNRRTTSVLISHHLYLFSERCLADLSGKDIYQAGEGCPNR